MVYNGLVTLVLSAQYTTMSVGFTQILPKARSLTPEMLVLAAESIVMLAVVLSLRQESGSQKPLVLY